MKLRSEWLAALTGAALGTLWVAQAAQAAHPTATPSPSPSSSPSPLISPAPASSPLAEPAVEPSPTPTATGASVTRVELRSPPGAKHPLQLQSPVLPLELAQKPLKGPKSELKWDLPLTFTSPQEDLTVLSGKEAAKTLQGKAVLTVPVKPGANSVHLTVVDSFGNVDEYDVLIDVARQDMAPPEEPKGFLVMGPVAYSRSITRGGSAAVDPGTVGAYTTGIRAIYRRRLLKEITDRLPGKFKIFFDGSGTLGKTVSGDQTAAGIPIWADARTTLEVYQNSGFRIEGGAGFSFFMPGLSDSQPGDVEQFFGFVLSGRLGYPITPKLSALLGASFVLPSSSSGESDLLVSQPLEIFLSASMPRGKDGYFEVRLKYYQITTSGTVLSAGDFSRKESFFGPEFLWVWKL